MQVLRDLRNSQEQIIHDDLGYIKRISFFCYPLESEDSNDSVYWVYEAKEIDIDIALEQIIQSCDEIKALKVLVLLKITRAMEAVAANSLGKLGLEAQTWQLQKTELEAYRANSKASTPFCDQIAKIRGISKKELMNKIEAKSKAYVDGVGSLLGIKQALEDKITKAEDIETLRGINWVSQ